MVGGEPFLCPFFQELIDYVYEKNIDLSVVSNGSIITDRWLEDNYYKFSTIGLSVDSLTSITNINLGRCCNNKTLNKNRIFNLTRKIKNLGITLKINICVNKLNICEDFNEFLTTVKPDRLKLLQMVIRPGCNDIAKDLLITKKDYEDFCSKYKLFDPVIECTEDIDGAYLIIDSEGYLLDTSKGENAHIGNLFDNELNDLIDKANFNYSAFAKIYKE